MCALNRLSLRFHFNFRQRFSIAGLFYKARGDRKSTSSINDYDDDDRHHHHQQQQQQQQHRGGGKRSGGGGGCFGGGMMATSSEEELRMDFDNEGFPLQQPCTPGGSRDGEFQ